MCHHIVIQSQTMSSTNWVIWNHLWALVCPPALIPLRVIPQSWYQYLLKEKKHSPKEETTEFIAIQIHHSLLLPSTPNTPASDTTGPDHRLAYQSCHLYVIKGTFKDIKLCAGKTGLGHQGHKPYIWPFWCRPTVYPHNRQFVQLVHIGKDIHLAGRRWSMVTHSMPISMNSIPMVQFPSLE
jgi:hypothetical protein